MADNAQIRQLVIQTAQAHGLDPNLLYTFANIESGFRPGTTTGSYKGLFQLSDAEFRKYGGTGSIYDPIANTQAAALKLKAETAQFERQYGRKPNATELYMVHQQGWGGAGKHFSNPDAPAWQNMYATGEGQAKGAGWARQAIWGNVPTDVRAKYGSVDRMTSRDFVNMWDGKVQRMGLGGPKAPPAPTHDPRNVAMNSGSAGVNPTGTAGYSGAIQTQTPNLPPAAAPAPSLSPAPVPQGRQDFYPDGHDAYTGGQTEWAKGMQQQMATNTPALQGSLDKKSPQYKSALIGVLGGLF